MHVTLHSRASPSCSLGTLSWSICDAARSNAQSPKREATRPPARACMPAGCARALDRMRASARDPHWKPMLHAPATSSPAVPQGVTTGAEPQHRGVPVHAFRPGPARLCLAHRHRPAHTSTWGLMRIPVPCSTCCLALHQQAKDGAADYFVLCTQCPCYLLNLVCHITPLQRIDPVRSAWNRA